MKHVVHVIGSLNVGGAERSVINYLEAADREQFRHTVVCLAARGDLASRVEALDVPIQVIRVKMSRGPWDLMRLARWMRRQDVAVVHSHLYYGSLWGRLAGIVAGVPVMVATEHGKELWKNRFQIWLGRRLAHRTCRIITVAEDGKKLRVEREGIPASKMTVIANGVPLPDLSQHDRDRAEARCELGLAEDGPVIGTVGRTVEAKGYGTLLTAMEELSHRESAPTWLLVGDGPERESLLTRAAERGLADRIVAPGKRQDIARLLAAMDVFVMPSIREGLPVALLEAMAAARPCVVTDVGGMPEALAEGPCGVIVPSEDPGRLAQAIGGMLDEPARARSLGEAARRCAEQRFSNQTVARRIEGIYQDCLDRGEGGGPS